MKERLLQVIEYYNITPYAFSQKIGVSEGTVRKILSENTTIRSDNLEKISQTFTDINLDWLITGRGEMLLTSDSNPPLNTENHPDSGIILELTRQISELSRENGQLQAENAELKKELARSEAAAAASARTA